MLELMRQNLELNSDMDPCEVEELNWGEPIPESVPAKPDVLLLAGEYQRRRHAITESSLTFRNFSLSPTVDCVYLETAFQPLVDTMVDLSTRDTEILVSRIAFCPN